MNIVQTQFTFHSPLILSHRWMIRRSENSNTADFKHAAPNWISIKRIASLPSYSTTDFAITFYPECTVPGLYRIVLRYVLH